LKWALTSRLPESALRFLHARQQGDDNDFLHDKPPRPENKTRTIYEKGILNP